MTGSRGAREPDVGYSDLLAHRGFLVLLAASSLSTWGDYITRITVASVIYQRTGSALATAATLAVSLVPVVLGRGVLATVADRLPYRDVLVSSHAARAVLVLVLLTMVASHQSVTSILVMLFLVEFLGGPATTAYQQMLTDLFSDRRLYAKAFGLGVVSEQVNQAIGLVAGGALVILVGPETTLLFDAVSFLVLAAVTLVVVTRRPIDTRGGPGLRGAGADFAEAVRHIAADRVQSSLLALSLVASLAMAAPEALAIPYASSHEGGDKWSGVLMAAPVLGAVVGLLLIGRRSAEWQAHRILALALLMPVPLLVTLVEPPVLVVAVCWFVCGCLQAFMLPLQATFTVLVPARLRGRVFGLAGALSVGVTGAAFLLAGWLSTHSTTAAAVGMCAVVSLGGIVLLAASWPRRALAEAIRTSYRADTARSATEQVGVELDGDLAELGDLAGATDRDDSAEPDAAYAPRPPAT